MVLPLRHDLVFLVCCCEGRRGSNERRLFAFCGGVCHRRVSGSKPPSSSGPKLSRCRESILLKCSKKSWWPCTSDSSRMVRVVQRSEPTTQLRPLVSRLYLLQAAPNQRIRVSNVSINEPWGQIVEAQTRDARVDLPPVLRRGWGNGKKFSSGGLSITYRRIRGADAGDDEQEDIQGPGTMHTQRSGQRND